MNATYVINEKSLEDLRFNEAASRCVNPGWKYRTTGSHHDVHVLDFARIGMPISRTAAPARRTPSQRELTEAFAAVVECRTLSVQSLLDDFDDAND